MDKPKKSIEELRRWGPFYGETMRSIIAYLDSIPDDAVPVVWPKELTRERLEEAAEALSVSDWCDLSKALRAIAAIAPERKKRMVNIWNDGRDLQIKGADWSPFNQSWRKVAGPVEIDE